MTTWHDSKLWSIRPDCRDDAVAALHQIQSEGLHRDNLYRKYTRSVARYLDMDELPIDMTDDGIAIVSVVGPLVNVVNPFTANYPLLRSAFERLASDNNVPAVVVRFKTPGGTVSGLDDCAQSLSNLAESRLTVGQVDGGCYSAGYYLASQCGSIACGATDHVGNIGTVLSIIDGSEMFRDAGIRSVTKKTGELKGLGIWGDPITKPQEKFLQSLVDQHFAHFKSAVMTGRGMDESAFAAISDGAYWLGETAVDNGIIDRVSTLDQTLNAIRTQLNL